MPLSPSDLALLAEEPLFRGLSAQELLLVYQITLTRSVSSDEYIFFQGDPASHVYFLLEGRMKLGLVTAEGQQVLLRILGAKSLFAIIGLTSNAPYPISAQAIEPSRVAFWRKDELKNLTRRLPQLALNAMDIMAVYVQEFQDRFREIATERVERRLARTLLRLAGQSGVKTSQGVLIDLPLTRQSLAEMIGATLYTVSRILSAWEEHAIVQSGRERITILAPHQLVLIADDAS
jgi:CRP/FNR family transcriptional regulator, nitrogen oxide reductase regulator